MNETNQAPNTLAQIRAQSPFPWSAHAAQQRQGVITIVDANGAEVSIFAIIDLLVLVTNATPR